MKMNPMLNMKNRVGMAAAGLLVSGYVAGQERPNIVVILADDMGYSDLGCYGGEVETPNLDRLAENGLRYRQFYNCARSCPSRAALMTGLYPHQAGMGWMTVADLQRPAYQGYINRNCVTLGEVLNEAGYRTCMSGKWHLSSERKNKGDVQDVWPNQRGFDRFYGIVGGASNYFRAVVNNDNTREPSPDDGSFYFTHAISDSAVAFIDKHHFEDSPLMLYVAYTAPHWPIQALQRDIDKYKDRYKAGWDRLREKRFARQKEIGLFQENTVLSPRDSRVPAWDTLSEEEQNEYAMRMAIYAAQIDAMDQGVGRIVSGLKEKGILDNTVILFMSDNGACAEHISSGERKAVDGKADTFESYRINWANLSSTPYREYKHYTNEGGIASPLIVHYPNGINKELKGHYVNEYGHFTDIMATCVELAGATYPEVYKGNPIVPMQGVSLVPNFKGENTRRTVTYWEHEANIGMRNGKWKMVTKTHEGERFDPSLVELYDMESDPTEMHNLAETDPVRCADMCARWNEWAESIGAFPLDTRFYGVREQTYKRECINGEFDDLFGDWGVVSKPRSGVRFTIDRENTISGDKTARIDIDGSGNKPEQAQLKWVFPTAKEHSQLSVSFKGKSTAGTSVLFKIERVDKQGENILTKKVELTDKLSESTFSDLILPEKGRYQLVFCFGNNRPATCWLDDVRMKVE